MRLYGQIYSDKGRVEVPVVTAVVEVVSRLVMYGRQILS